MFWRTFARCKCLCINELYAGRAALSSARGAGPVALQSSRQLSSCCSHGRSRTPRHVWDVSLSQTSGKGHIFADFVSNLFLSVVIIVRSRFSWRISYILKFWGFIYIVYFPLSFIPPSLLPPPSPPFPLSHHTVCCPCPWRVSSI